MLSIIWSLGTELMEQKSEEVAINLSEENEMIVNLNKFDAMVIEIHLEY